MRGLVTAGVVSLLAFGMSGCGEDGGGPLPPSGGDDVSFRETLPTSLHGTTRGMEYFYLAEKGGFEEHTGVPYEDLACQNCHANSCTDCHSDSRGQDVVPQETCLGCHSRQGLEAFKLGISDAHRDAGMECMDCHTSREMHGDGTEYNSMLEEGAMDADCENSGCHPSVSDEPQAHRLHLEDVACSSCHMQAVATCNNCHFDTEVAGGGKVFLKPPPSGWLFLMNFRGKVYPANMQSLVFGQTSFAAMAPFYSHTISREGRDCASCHQSEALRQYLEEGVIEVTSWNPDRNNIDAATGVIPVPPDWEDAFLMDFADLVGGEFGESWVFMKSGLDDTQMLFGEPMTLQQLDRMNFLSAGAMRTRAAELDPRR